VSQNFTAGVCISIIFPGKRKGRFAKREKEKGVEYRERKDNERIKGIKRMEAERKGR
jgi:hypothetical protein